MSAGRVRLSSKERRFEWAGDLVYIAPGEQHKIVVDDDSKEPLVLFAVVAPNFGNDAVFPTEATSEAVGSN